MGGAQSNDGETQDQDFRTAGTQFVRGDYARRLCKLIERDDANEVETFLCEKEDISDYAIGCFFQQAVLQGSSNVVKVFLRRGVNVNTPDAMFGESALMMAARIGNMEMVDLLLAHGSNINYKSVPAEDTAFHTAASSNRTDCLLRLLEVDQASMNAQNKLGLTPVMVAAMRGQTECVELLVHAGCDICIRNDAGDNIMHIIIKSFESVLVYDRFTVTKCLDLLIQHGIDVNETGQDGYSPIQLCVACNNIHALKRFVRANCDLNMGNESPLELAIRKTNANAVRLLIESGCDVHNLNMRSDNVGSWLQNASISLPHRLKFLCKCVIRKKLGILPESSAFKLPIPVSLKNYILSFE